jgi:hypothetical protein
VVLASRPFFSGKTHIHRAKAPQEAPFHGGARRRHRSRAARPPSAMGSFDHVRLAPISSAIADMPIATRWAKSRRGFLSLCLRQRLRDFASTVGEKLRDGAERTILQGDNSVWHAGHR